LFWSLEHASLVQAGVELLLKNPPTYFDESSERGVEPGKPVYQNRGGQMLRDKRIVGVIIIAAGLIAGLFFLLSWQQQQLKGQLSQKEQTAVALATAGTAEALGGAAQAANATAFALSVTAAVRENATAQAGTAVAQAAAATAQAGTATAQARLTATA
jgi:hypothetical protein